MSNQEENELIEHLQDEVAKSRDGLDAELRELANDIGPLILHIIPEQPPEQARVRLSTPKGAVESDTLRGALEMIRELG